MGLVVVGDTRCLIPWPNLRSPRQEEFEFRRVRITITSTSSQRSECPQQWWWWTPSRHESRYEYPLIPLNKGILRFAMLFPLGMSFRTQPERSLWQFLGTAELRQDLWLRRLGRPHPRGGWDGGLDRARRRRWRGCGHVQRYESGDTGWNLQGPGQWLRALCVFQGPVASEFVGKKQSPRC